MNINVVPYPDRAVLKGKNAPYYKIEQVKLDFLIYHVSTENNFRKKWKVSNIKKFYSLILRNDLNFPRL